jgi:hypothetical protein
MASDDDVLPREVLRHGAYLCLTPYPDADRARLADAPIERLARATGLRNEFGGQAAGLSSIAFLRVVSATPGQIADDGVLDARWIVHVSSGSPQTLATFCDKARALLDVDASVRVLAGVVRPRSYTGAAMERFAYARAVTQQPGLVMPNAFLIPMSKTAEWWRKGWMERHTYFLPRYADDGTLLADGHALASAAGIPCLVRRTYHAPEQPATGDAYDFLTYFECTDADVPVFAEVCAALRDVRRNPEWKFVREGPTWQGRRVPNWSALFRE